MTRRDLDQPLNLFEPIDVKSDSWNKAARYLQGNIAQGHGRKHSAVIPFRINQSEKSRLALAQLALGYVTSAHQQDERARARALRRGSKAYDAYVDTELFGFLYISIWGYRKLRYPQDHLCSAFKDPEGGQNWFLDGIEAHDMIQNEISRWDSAYKHRDVDALLVLACDHQPVLKIAVEQAIDQICSFGSHLGVEYGSVLRNHLGRIEPFGFVDNISKPDIFALDPNLPEAADPGRSPVLPVHLLVRDRMVDEEYAFGSYLVYCKLEQDVQKFNQAAEALALHRGVTKDRAEAMIIGRFKDGTPLSESDAPVGGTPGSPDFITSRDLAGSKCPFQAHIRKVNPRTNAEGSQISNPLFRRGVPYGAEGTSPTGLLFLALQSDIARQFGAIMRAWVNEHDFPVAGTGSDAMMGPPCGAQAWPSDAGLPPEGCDIKRHITFRGGEFFFAPSLLFFESLLSKARTEPRP